MKYAVIQIGGKQFKVSDGDVFEIERQSTLDYEVLMYVDGEEVEIGEPFLARSLVKLSKVLDKIGPKINTSRFRAKSRYRRKASHRQPLTVLKVELLGNKKSVGSKKVSKTTSEAKKEEAKSKTKDETKVKTEKKTAKKTAKVEKTTKVENKKGK